MKKVRLEPRISANKLGEYQVAKAGRRLAIIKDQKHPRDFIVARYMAAYDAIARSIASGCDPVVITEAIEKLYDTPPKSMWHQQDIQLSVEALDSFLSMIDDLDVGDFDAVRATDGPQEMKIGGVQVSIRPDLFLRDRTTREVVGVVKLSILKSNSPLDGEKADDEPAMYVGALLHQYANEVLSPQTKIPAANCLVIDVFAQQVHHAPKSYKRRREDLRASCLEIARGWDDA